MAREVAFGQILELLMKERYRRNRAALAEILHMSPSSLSQYVRGRATPSLEVLVHLAEHFDVSLDYLVLDQERTASPPERGTSPGISKLICETWKNKTRRCMTLFPASPRRREPN